MRRQRGEASPVFNGETANYGVMLAEKRREVMAAMGMKFDTMSTAGRVAEEDQAQMSHDEFINLRLNKIDYDVLRLINEAIDRLKTGDYGVCQRCEERISQRRLEVIPWAKYCVHCQERMARHEQEEDATSLVSAW